MSLKKKLAAIQNEDKYSIRSDVAETALSYGDSEEEIKSFFSDLLSHGCQSGMISHLIYYKDTDEYYRSHVDEIDDLKQELEEEIGEPLKIGSPIQNWLAWFGFEETARKVADEIGLEI